MDRLFAALVALVAATAPAAATYPERNITVICASGAGGIVDVTTRIITDHMSKTLGRTLVVQNEPGAGSTLAMGLTSATSPIGPRRRHRPT
jgi:tripartite-type tricarboxylate transporter receptor subunit TctC